MDQQIIPPEPHHGLRRRSFGAILSAPLTLVIATVGILCLWLLLTLSLVLALLACAALVALGLPISALLAKRSWRLRFPSREPELPRRLDS